MPSEPEPVSGTFRADRLTAVVLFALGVGMLWGGFAMDRLEVRQIHPASIPGLVPMILGGALALCAVLLYLGARREPGRADDGEVVDEDTRGAGKPDGTPGDLRHDTHGIARDDAAEVIGRVPSGAEPREPAEAEERPSTSRLAITALWSTCYALVLVGRLPFAVATALYIALFVLWFGRPGGGAFRGSAPDGARPSVRLLATAAVVSVLGAYAIATLFESGFLVRLP